MLSFFPCLGSSQFTTRKLNPERYCDNLSSGLTLTTFRLTIKCNVTGGKVGKNFLILPAYHNRWSFAESDTALTNWFKIIFIIYCTRFVMIAELEFYTLIGYYKCNWLRPESDERIPANVPDFFIDLLLNSQITLTFKLVTSRNH